MKRILFAALLLNVSLAALAQQQVINVGTFPNDHTGDSLRTGILKVNANEAQLYGSFGGGSCLHATGTVCPGDLAGVINVTGLLRATPTSFRAAITSDVTSLLSGAVLAPDGNGVGLYVSAPNAAFALFGIQTAGANRWQLGKNSASEGGSNAGSDFTIAAFADGGGFLGNPMSIIRATGMVSIPAPYSGTGRSLSLGSGAHITETVVASLPATCAAGDLLAVSDATAPTYGGILTGGGAVHALALCGPANSWKAH